MGIKISWKTISGSDEPRPGRVLVAYTLPGWLVRKRSKMSPPRVGIFYNLFQAEIGQVFQKVIMHGLRLPWAFDIFVRPIKVGQVKVTKKCGTVFGILLTDSQSSERLFSSSS